jgi:hypothetical protein
MHGSVRSVANSTIFPAMRPFNKTMDGLLDGYRIGLRTGEPEKVITGVLAYFFAYLCIGLPLGPLESDLISYGREASQFGAPVTIQIIFKVLRQTAVNIRNTNNEMPTSLKGEVMDQDEELANVKGNGAAMMLRDINTFRLMLACVYNDWETAEQMVNFLERYPWVMTDSSLDLICVRPTWAWLLWF